MIVENVDQREIQKRGGLYAKFPGSYVICSILDRYNCKSVLDVTYGEGRFYMFCRDNIDILIGSDPKRWDWVVKPDLFYPFNVFHLYMLLSKKKFDIPIRGVDVVVVDPPRWTTYAIYNRRKMFNYLVGTPESIFETSGKIAKLLNTRYVLVHYRNVVKLEQYIPIHLVEFKWFARYLNTENKNTSLYILYKRKQNIE
jgi:hypothetical protein